MFLICFANMLLEVVITRLFSATMFYHFTFLAVALALFGIAASGVYVFVAGERLAVDLRDVIAIYGGFTMTFLVGAAAYLGAGFLGARIAKQLPSSPD